MYKHVLILLYCLSLLTVSIPVNSQDIVISALEHDINQYNLWLDNNKCTEISNFNNKYASPTIIQMVIICKALNYGGMTNNISFLTTPNYSRSLLEAQKGRVAIPSDSVWLKQINQKDFFFSKPIFKKSEFQKVFYVLPKNRQKIENEIKLNKSQNITPLQTLRNYTVVTSPNWRFDVELINKLGMPTVQTTNPENMCKMIAYGRAQLYLGEIIMGTANNLALNCNHLFLEPIEGVKVVFDESRHFVVSKKYPNSDKIFDALEKGLAIMRERGEIEQAIYPVGSNQEKIEGWEVLVPSSD